MIKTNDLKKGDVVKLRNGLIATILDNRRGDTRLVEVQEFVNEIGSTYSHDIMFLIKNGVQTPIEHTKKQVELRNLVNLMSSRSW